MAVVRVYRQGNYLVVAEDATADVIFSIHAVSAFIEPDGENPDVFRFYDKRGNAETEERLEFFFADISEIKDNETVPAFYNRASFIEFYTTNTGTEVTSTPASTDYFKDEVVVVTTSNNFNSSTPTNIPGMTYTIPVGFDGDYVFYTIVNCNNDQNEELDMYFAVNGTTILNSRVTDRQQKNQDQSIQGTYPINGLVAGNVVTVQFDTRNDNVDLELRRILIQSWELV